MPTWLKIIMTLFIGFLMVLLAGAIFLYSKKDEIKEVLHEVMEFPEELEKTIVETEKFKGQKSQACLKAYLVKEENSKGLFQGPKNLMFLAGCFSTVEKSPQFCDKILPKIQVEGQSGFSYIKKEFCQKSSTLPIKTCYMLFHMSEQHCRGEEINQDFQFDNPKNI